MVWDQFLALILYGKGKVYVDPRIVSHHRTIVEKGGSNYQSRYAVEDHKVSDAYMYARHEEYMEKVLHRSCTKFYQVRGMIIAETFWIAMNSHKREDWERASQIWKQRRKKWPLIVCTVQWACKSLKRKANRTRGTENA